MNTNTQPTSSYSRNGKEFVTPSFGFASTVTGTNLNPDKIDLFSAKLNKLRKKYKKL